MGNRTKNAAILTAVLCLAGCGSDDSEQLAKVARLSAAKVEDMTGGAPTKVAAGLDTMRANWNELALDVRVLLRLRWERDLQNVTIQVTAKNGIVELRGNLHDMAQRQRAVQLARTTAGVVEVMDSLEVMSGE